MVSPGPRPGPDFIHYNLDFALVRLRILSIFETVSESGIYQASPGPCPGPDFIHFESGSGFHQACPGPRPDSTNTLNLFDMTAKRKDFIN